MTGNSRNRPDASETSSLAQASYNPARNHLIDRENIGTGMPIPVDRNADDFPKSAKRETPSALAVAKGGEYREVGLMSPQNRGWFKSSFSASGQNCVEVCFAGGMAMVRNSFDPAGPVLMFNRGEWDAFELGVVNGEFAMPQ